MKELLKKNFGFNEFRPGQEEILEKIWAGESVLALMPTGQGKSLCFQFPAKLREGVVVVISPLIALMQDQVIKAKDFGIAATFLSSTVGKEERELRQKKISENRYKLIFVTPERFRKPEFLAAIQDLKIQLLAVDEAHCISQWGHDFRPDYSKLGEFRALLGDPPVLALTATATPEVRKDIVAHLRIVDSPVVETGIERPNLSLRVESVYGFDEKVRGIVGLRHLHQGPAIIYVTLIHTLKKLSSELQRLGMEHLVYHGDLQPAERTRSLKRFIEDPSPLMIATPAFGLGIDKANVRLVVHAEPPGSLEAYFQEVGRAGRDGLEAFCYLLYDADDVSIQMEFLKWSHPEESYIRKVFQLIQKRGPLDQEGFDYIREQLSFKNRHDYRPEAAVSILERWGCVQKCNLPFPFEAVNEPTDENFTLENSEVLLKAQNHKLLEMVRFANMEEGCRLQKIYEYFGHSVETVCGRCDLCT